MKPKSAVSGRLLRIAVGLVAISSLPIPAAIAQSDWLTFRSSEFKFRFLYPPTWHVVTPRGPNVRASINSPAGNLFANCNIVVRAFPEIAKVSQKDLNAELSTPFSENEWLNIFTDKFSDVRLWEHKLTKVDNQPAQFGIVSMSYEAVNFKAWSKAMNVITFKPGQFWHFGCSAGGGSQQDMLKSFDYWNPTLMRILSTLVFEQ